MTLIPLMQRLYRGHHNHHLWGYLCLDRLPRQHQQHRFSRIDHHRAVAWECHPLAISSAITSPISGRCSLTPPPHHSFVHYITLCSTALYCSQTVRINIRQPICSRLICRILYTHRNFQFASSGGKYYLHVHCPGMSLSYYVASHRIITCVDQRYFLPPFMNRIDLWVCLSKHNEYHCSSFSTHSKYL